MVDATGHSGQCGRKSEGQQKKRQKSADKARARASATGANSATQGISQITGRADDLDLNIDDDDGHSDSRPPPPPDLPVIPSVCPPIARSELSVRPPRPPCASPTLPFPPRTGRASASPLSFTTAEVRRPLCPCASLHTVTALISGLCSIGYQRSTSAVQFPHPPHVPHLDVPPHP